MKFFKTMMFRYLRLFFILLAVLVAAEVGVFAMINNSYLADNTNYLSKVIINGVQNKPIFTNNSLTTSAQSLACSHDGKYLAYKLNGKLNILDMINKNTYSVDDVKDMSLSYFKWVYDRNRLIVAEKYTGTKYNEYIKLYYYDITEKKLTEIYDYQNNVEYKINMSDKTDEVTDIDMSAATQVTYVTVTDKSKKNTVWKINVGVSGNTVSTYTKNIGKIQCLKDKDYLYYEDSSTGKLYKSGSNIAVTVGGSSSLKLLGFDSNENTYVAVVKDSKTSAIYYGDIINKKWNPEVKLDKAVYPESIYVNFRGNVYINDKTNNAMIKVLPVENTTTSSQISSKTSSSKSSSKSASSKGASSQVEIINGIDYTGSVVSIYDSGFITNDSGIIKHYEFK